MPLDLVDPQPCPVCTLLATPSPDVVVAERDAAVAYVPSRHPAPGTSLVVTRRHVLLPEDLSDAEADHLWELLRAMVGACLAATGAPSYHVSQYLGRLTDEPLSHLYWRIEPRHARPPSIAPGIRQLPTMPHADRVHWANSLREALGRG